MLGLIVLSLSASGVSAQGPAGADAPGGAAASGSGLGATQEKLAIGDRLMIVVFERYGAMGSGGESSQLVALVERPEMSGEYIVQQDGALFVPLIGSIPALDQTNATLQQGLADRYAGVFGEDMEVIVRIVSREPIYVTGAVPQAGSHSYSPGMIVLHALAMSGAGSVTDADRWRHLDLARELERTRQSENRLISQLVPAVVLLEERGYPSDAEYRRLATLTGETAADRLIAEAQQVRAMERDRLNAESLAVAALQESLVSELQILHESIAESEAEMNVRLAILQDQPSSEARDAAAQRNYHLLHVELGETRLEWNNLRGALNRVERNILELRQQVARLAMDEAIRIERDLLTLRASIVAEETTQSILASLVQTMQGPRLSLVDGDTGGPDVRIEVFRRTPNGMERIEADALTPLRPGDLVNIRKLPPELADVARPVSIRRLDDSGGPNWNVIEEAGRIFAPDGVAGLILR